MCHRIKHTIKKKAQTNMEGLGQSHVKKYKKKKKKNQKKDQKKKKKKKKKKTN